MQYQMTCIWYCTEHDECMLFLHHYNTPGKSWYHNIVAEINSKPTDGINSEEKW